MGKSVKENLKLCEQGAALIAAIVFSSVMLSLSAISLLSLAREGSVLKARQNSFSQLSELKRNLAFGEAAELNQITPRLLIEEFSSGSLEAKLTWANNRAILPSPDWALLETLPRKSCSNTSSAGSTAALTCHELSSTYSSYPGNLKVEEDLHLPLPLYFIKGDFEVPGILELASENRLTVVIALGEIKAHALRGTPNQQLLLYSATGRIEIPRISTPVTLCNNTEEGLKLSLMTRAAKVIGGITEDNSYLLGCPVELSEKLWPKETLLAQTRP